MSVENKDTQKDIQVMKDLACLKAEVTGLAEICLAVLDTTTQLLEDSVSVKEERLMVLQRKRSLDR